MKPGELTDEMRRFILTSIPSVPYLEAILLLRTEPATGWDAQLVARRLYVGENRRPSCCSRLPRWGSRSSAILRQGSIGTYGHARAGRAA